MRLIDADKLIAALSKAEAAYDNGVVSFLYPGFTDLLQTVKGVITCLCILM